MQEEFKYETRYAITPEQKPPLEYSIAATLGALLRFKTHGGGSVPSKTGRSPKQIKANRKKNKNARKARKKTPQQMNRKERENLRRQRSSLLAIRALFIAVLIAFAYCIAKNILTP